MLIHITRCMENRSLLGENYFERLLEEIHEIGLSERHIENRGRQWDLGSIGFSNGSGSDTVGNRFIADTANNRIREVATTSSSNTRFAQVAIGGRWDYIVYAQQQQPKRNFREPHSCRLSGKSPYGEHLQPGYRFIVCKNNARGRRCISNRKCR